MIRTLIVLMAVAATASQTDRLPVGYDRPDWLEERMSAVEHLTDSLKYDEAETAARELLVDAEKRAGPDSVEAAEAIDVLVEVLFRDGRSTLPEAQLLARRAVDTKQRHLEAGNPGIAVSLYTLSRITLAGGRAAEAKELGEQALAMMEKTLGSDHPLLTDFLVGLCYVELELDNGSAALERCQAAREIVEQGPDSYRERMISVLTALAEAQAHSDDIESAIATLRENLALAEKLPSPPVLDLLSAYELTGAYLQMSGQTDEARASLERAVHLGEQHLPPDSARLALVLRMYGQILADTGEFEEAERLLLRALEIQELALGDESGELLGTLRGLIRLYSARGNLPRVKQTAQRALAIAERNDPSGAGESVRIARASWAGVLAQEGDLRSALRVYRDLLAAIEGTDREKSQHGIIVHANMGSFLEVTGRLTEARRHTERAIELILELYGKESPMLLMPTRLLAQIAYELGDFPRAERILLQNLDLEKRLWGPDSPQLRRTMTSLATLHLWEGDHEAADRWYQRAIDVTRRGLDADDPDMAHQLIMAAGNLIDLERIEEARSLVDEADAVTAPRNANQEATRLKVRAKLHMERGELEAARSLFDRLLELELHAYGQVTDSGVYALAKLAEADWLLGDADGALERALEAEAAAVRLLELAGELTEREILQADVLRSGALEIVVSVFATRPNDAARETLAREILARTVAARGQALDRIAMRHRDLMSDPSPEVQQKTLELEAAREQVARLMNTETEADPALKTALEERHAAERALVEASTEHGRRPAGLDIGLGDVERALAQDEAIVSYVRYREVAGFQDDEFVWIDDPPLRYAVWILKPVGTHVFVPLASAEEIDALVEQWRSQVARPPLALGAAEARPNAYHRAATSLRRAVWDPVVTHLGQARQVFVVPEGGLHLVSLATLPNDDGSYLVEGARVLHYLSAERDLVPVGSPIDEKRRGLLAIGAPDFEHHSLPFAEIDSAPTDDDPGPDATHAATETVALYRSPPALCPDLKQASFSPLPGARVETTEIVGLWQQHDTATPSPAVELTGVRASEEAFKRMAPDYGVLHVATHGFFVQASCRTKEQLVRGTRARTTAAGEVVDSSMLLSGVVLAGANQRSTPEGVAAPEDGMLTAEEIAHLDLRGVEWVVLSACDTGLGDVIEGEGVFGLRRAFAVAGAGAVIMSLWRVPDGSPREWMRALYEHRLAGASTADSVRAASLEVIAARRKDGRSTHPYYWGAFVASGD